MTKVKSISFTEEYMKEYKYFEGKANKSRYICELIRKDMDNSRNIDREYIEKLIEEKMKKIPLHKTEEGESDGDEIRDILSDFF